MRLVVVAAAVALPFTAASAEPPAHVKPFLFDEPLNDDSVHVATGALGPAKDTTIVVTLDPTYRGFALVPDAKAKHGHRKLALPRLPANGVEGIMTTVL